MAQEQIKGKRKRSTNWDALEKSLLQNCIKDFVDIIENKNIDTNTNKSKNVAWQKVTERFNELNSRARSAEEVKQQWRCMNDAKKKVSNYSKLLKGTGGGEKPTSPDPATNEIISMIPQEFKVDFNIFDSDGTSTKVKDSVSQPVTEAAVILPVDDVTEYTLTPVRSVPSSSQITGQCSQNRKRRLLDQQLPKSHNMESSRQRNDVLIKCILEEHELKMLQMRESHSWAKKEAELRIENLQLENMLLKSKVQK